MAAVAIVTSLKKLLTLPKHETVADTQVINQEPRAAKKESSRTNRWRKPTVEFKVDMMVPLLSEDPTEKLRR